MAIETILNTCIPLTSRLLVYTQKLTVALDLVEGTKISLRYQPYHQLG